MTQATISHSMPGRTSLQLRRVDGIELPVAGTWTVPGNHATIAFCVPRRLRRPDSCSGRARGASVVISEDPDDVVVAVRFDVPRLEIAGSPAGTIGLPIALEAPDRPGPSTMGAVRRGVLRPGCGATARHPQLPPRLTRRHPPRLVPLSGCGTSYTEPGSRWKYPWAESHGSRVRDELLAIEPFHTLAEAQVLIADWRIENNTYRPHSALGMLTPAEFADQWRRTKQPQLS
jgi:transposase InsO family protein